MNSTHIIWPVLAQIFLTLIMLIVLGARKAKAVKVGDVNRQQAAFNNRVWPEDVVKVSNSIANQFETPLPFYVLCLVFYRINAAGLIAIVLAWMFVLSRLAHAYVQIGSNYVPMRLRFFLIGCLVLIAMLLLGAWSLTSVV